MPDTENEFQTITFSGYQGKSVTLNVIYEDISGDRFIRLSISPNRLRAYLEYEIINPDFEPGVKDIMEFLEEQKITHELNVENVVIFLELMRHTKGKFGPFEIASGTYPVRGDDGRIDFIVNPSSNKARYKSDDQGNINYHDTFLIENAYKGHTIAVIKKPTLGIAGKDVYGKSINADSGDPITVKIGEKVSFEQKSGKCTAEIDGRVVYEENTISMSDVYEVSGDVDLSIGNINFVGEVIIRGDVVGDFSIHGKKQVYVEGRCGPSKISSEGDVYIRGGIAGNGENTLIKSEKGIFKTKYVDNCRIETSHGVVVKNEIINSIICTGGIVSIPTGAIIGGNIAALKGIEVGAVGSELGVITHIGSGQDWTKEDKVSFFEEKLEMVNGFLNDLVENVSPLAGDINAVKMYTGKKRNTIKSAIEKMKILKSKQAEIMQEIEILQAEKNAEAVYQININKTLYTGSVLKIGPLMDQVRDTRNGPLSVIQDTNGEFIRIGTQTKLFNDIQEINYPY